MCFLQGNNLYVIEADEDEDRRSLFMELSRLFFDGTSEFHMANFLCTIAKMKEYLPSEEQVESFISNTQNIPKLPDEEPVWALSLSSLVEAEISLPSDHVPSTNERIFPRRKAGISSNWPPVDWKTAPDFSYARANGFKTKAGQISNTSEVKKDDTSEGIVSPPISSIQGSASVDWNIIDNPSASSVSLVLRENENLDDQSYHDFEPTSFSNNNDSYPVSLGENMDEAHLNSPAFTNRDRLSIGTFDTAQTKRTGRLGEFLACKYFTDKFGKTAVRWVNEVNETGFPYDIVIGEDTSKEFIEVKATTSPRKDWFNISFREWQFAIEKGESFSIAFVVINGNNVARVAIFKDPVKLCQLGELQLAVMMPKQQKQLPVAS